MSIYTFPIGAPQDVPFTDTDLLNVDHEFVTDGAYFGNADQTILCVPSLLNPAIQWCAPKAELWIAPAYVAIPTVHQPAPCPTPRDPVTTPEPSLLWFLIGAALLAKFTRRLFA